MSLLSSLAFIVCLVLSVAFALRIFLAIFSETYRGFFRQRPWIHVGWAALSAVTLFHLVPKAFTSPQRRPGTYREMKGQLYWQCISSASAKELMRKDGLIFFYRRDHHGPQFLVIREDEAAATRQEGLRKVVDDFSYHPVWQKFDMLALLNLATRTNHGSIKSFREWWEREGKDFLFDEEAHHRLRDYNFGKGNPDERLRYIEPMLGEERKLILEGQYRTNLKPREAAPPHPPAQY